MKWDKIIFACTLGLNSATAGAVVCAGQLISNFPFELHIVFLLGTNKRDMRTYFTCNNHTLAQHAYFVTIKICILCFFVFILSIVIM